MSSVRARATSGAIPVPIWEDQSDVDNETAQGAPQHPIDHHEDGENAPNDSDVATDDDIADSIEDGPNYKWKISFERKQYPKQENRHVSTATAIHLDDEEDPFVEDDNSDDDEDDAYPGDESDGCVEDSYIAQYDADEEHDVSDYGTAADEEDEESIPSRLGHRAVSDLSTMPDELDIPIRTPNVTSRRGTPTTYTPSSTYQQYPRDRLLSSSSRSGAGSVRHYSPAPITPTRGHDRYVSSPLAQRGSAFRNPSSVRAMQLSSPSPPRSARQRRLEQEQLSRNRSATPSHHANPDKEYPLILLHCSFNLLLPPYPSALLDAVLPRWVQENLALLLEKVTQTVVDRGVLIPHPGEDYELLEERILESLELKKPRVDKSGHFLGEEPAGELAAPFDGEGVNDFNATTHAPGNCATCSNPVHTAHRGTAGDAPHRRFDLRVYAANGLMRAGAWSASWREMEKVDVEIGVWIPDEVRKALDEAMALHMKDSTGRGEHANPRWSGDVPVSAPSPPQRQRVVSASMAACSKPKDEGVGRRKRRGDVRSAEEQIPLSSLLVKYLQKRFAPTKELGLQLLVVVLAIAVFRAWYFPAPAVVPVPTRIDLDAIALENASSWIVTPAQTGDTGGERDGVILAADVTTPALRACTFAPSEAESKGMTALPADVAKRVMDAVRSEHPSPTAEALTVPTRSVEDAEENLVVDRLVVEPDRSQSSRGVDEAAVFDEQSSETGFGGVVEGLETMSETLSEDAVVEA